MDNKDYNRIKVALVEQKKTARWLSDALGKDPAIGSHPGSCKKTKLLV